MWFKKKTQKMPDRIIPGMERTEDTHVFFIPKIAELDDKVTSKRTFVSPIFGKHVKDEVVVPKDRQDGTDIDKKYDAFRKHKKLTKEEAKNRYGNSYYEFHTISNADKKKILSGEVDADDLNRRPSVPEVSQAEQPQTKRPDSRETDQVSITEFFQTVQKQAEQPASILSDLPNPEDEFEMHHDRGRLEPDRFGPVEEEEQDRVLFQGNEPLPVTPPPSPIPDQPPRFESEPKDNPALEKMRSQILTDFDTYVLPPVAILKKSAPRSTDTPAW
ncbi:MAG TPA: hypothetical protein PLZ76_05950, partial [Bacillota bacterium]|nr:hypothetical protein [Bacillota bacterium]